MNIQKQKQGPHLYPLTMYEQRNSSDPNPAYGNNSANNALWNLTGRPGSHQSSNAAALPTSIPQSIFSNPSVQPSSVINLSNSSDVVIGPMTQYQGPVTIYQYMDATVEARSMQANGGGMSNSPHTGVTGLLMDTQHRSLYICIYLIRTGKPRYNEYHILGMFDIKKLIRLKIYRRCWTYFIPKRATYPCMFQLENQSEVFGNLNS